MARRLPSPAAARAIRLGAGVTQQELADELAVYRVTVARWEAGDRTPRGPLRVRYVELLEQLAALLSGEHAHNDDEPARETGSSLSPPGMATDAANKS
jgi:transcriptional regulator with XRE-family HTH domain